MRAGPEPVLEIESISKEYDGHPVLRRFDVTVFAGDVCVIVGPSGCGKSTLLRIVVGEDRPSAGGSIRIDGNEVVKPSIRCGIVFQRYSLFPHLTVLKNLQVHIRFQEGRDKAEEKQRAVMMLNELGLKGHGKKYPFELSGGMQQRVAVAQALLARPRVLLMDEPFGALDPTNRARCQDLLVRVGSEEGITILLVTHDLAEAAFVGTRLLALRDIRQSEAAASIVHDYNYKLGCRFHPDERASERYEKVLLEVMKRASIAQ